MIVLYNSDSFAVMQVDLPGEPNATGDALSGGRSGLEIVDKTLRKGIFLDGDMAAGFMAGVEALTQQTTDLDAIDDHLARYTASGLQTVVLH